jgi:Fe-S cluster biosynthesis and repair protein YggX
VSKEAWKQSLANKEARDYLVQQMEKYFFGSGAGVAAG